MIRLILLDVDGTLTGAGQRIHPTTWTALQTARDRGVHLAVCTGRPGYGEAATIAAQVSPTGLHIFQNGAVVATPDGHVGHAAELPAADYTGIVEAARADARPLEVYTPRTVYLERRDDRTERHAALIGLQPETRDLLSIDEPVVRVQWVVARHDLEHVQAITRRFPSLELGWALHMDMPGTIFASVTRRGTSKASSARWLAEHHGLTLAETAMVGDGEGDLETIRAAGLGIAMGNAIDAVKAAADATVASVDAGGLAEAIHLALERR